MQNKEKCRSIKESSRKDDVKVSQLVRGSKARKDKKTTPGKYMKQNLMKIRTLTPKKVSPGSKVRKESRDNKAMP